MTMNSDDVLARLSDGQFHSEEALARHLGVSRTAVCKQVAALADIGMEVERIRGRGYRIPDGLELLHSDRVRACLSDRAIALLEQIHIHGQIDSTNAALLREQPPAAGRGRAMLAELQTQGRGRRGKTWVSPFACNLYLSMDWLFAGGVGEVEGLSLAIGVAVAEAIADSGLDSVSLKWPNDILFDGHKLGGILVELSGDAEGPCRVVVGVGLNVAMPAKSAATVDQAWTDLATARGGEAPSRNALAANVLNRCLPLLASYPEVGFSHWQDRWMRRDAFGDSPVTLTSASATTHGVARGVDERGLLLLETESGLLRISGGEVSLRVRA